MLVVVLFVVYLGTLEFVISRFDSLSDLGSNVYGSKDKPFSASSRTRIRRHRRSESTTAKRRKYLYRISHRNYRPDWS